MVTLRGSRPLAGGPPCSARISSAWRAASRARGSAVMACGAPARAAAHGRPDLLKLGCDLRVGREVVIAFEENTWGAGPRAQLLEQLEDGRGNWVGVGVVV